MKIVVIGPIFVNVNFYLDELFDVLGTNFGCAKSVYCSEAMNFAKKASADNDVIFLSSVDTEAEVFILKKLESFGINTQYMSHEAHGTGFKVTFTDLGPHCIHSYPSLTCVNERLRTCGDEILNDADAVVLSYIDPEIVEICKAHRVRMYWLKDEFNSDRIDDSDWSVIKDLPDAEVLL